jgi:hypothetical protein
LKYEAPQVCPTEDLLRADIAAHVRSGARSSGVRIEIHIVAADGRFAGELLATDRLGSEDRQSVEGDNCAEIAHALAFRAGVAIELGEGPPTSIAVSTAARTPPGTPSPALPPSVRPRAFWITGRIMAGIMGGLSNGPSPSGEVGVAIEDARPRVLAVAAEAALLVAENRIHGTGGSADVSLVGGRLAVCPARISTPHVEIRPCAGLALAAVRVRATSLVNAPSVTQRWTATEATLAARWSLTERIFVDLEGGLVFPLVRPSYAFEFDPPGEALYTVPRVTAGAAGGVGFRF